MKKQLNQFQQNVEKYNKSKSSVYMMNKMNKKNLRFIIKMLSKITTIILINRKNITLTKTEINLEVLKITLKTINIKKRL